MWWMNIINNVMLPADIEYILCYIKWASGLLSYWLFLLDLLNLLSLLDIDRIVY